MGSFSRWAWARYRCAPSRYDTIAFGTGRITVADVATPAMLELAKTLEAHGITPTPPDTGAYNCRYIGGTSTWSPHAYGAAVDVNWQRNPAMSRGSIPANRYDPRHTEMTPAAIKAVTSIRTNNGKQVFQWGGAWRTFYDPMHFDTLAGPNDLATGIRGALKPLTPGMKALIWALAKRAARNYVPGSGGYRPGKFRQLKIKTPRMRGRDVSDLRSALGLRARGSYGRKPLKLIKAMQGYFGLPVTGKVDQATWELVMYRYFLRAWGYAP